MSVLTLLGRKKKTTPIGMDVGASAVRAVQLSQYGAAHVIEAAAKILRQPSPDNATEAPDNRATAIRDCINQGSFRGTVVRTALNTPEVELHAMELPEAVSRAAPAEADRIVQWEVRRLATREWDAMESRFWTLPKARPSVPNAIGVAAPRDEVLHLIRVAREAGAMCTGVDVAAAALARFGSMLVSWPDDTVWGLLDVSLRRTRLVLCVEDVPVLARDAGTGGMAWTSRIAESLEVSEKTAEIHKCETGLELSSARGVRDTATDAPLSELGSILTGILKRHLTGLATEVKRSYEYLLNCYADRKAGMLVLVGGGAALRNLPEFFTDSLGIPVQRASDLLTKGDAKLQVAVSECAPLDEYALAVGLAIEG